ncbi:MAG: hypothetical protein EPO22_03650 [Dehalococcoidia bacterium]|nr:MAG: hypothetical protein EPO22_03650 [Dehalococcoidia bacterium]
MHVNVIVSSTPDVTVLCCEKQPVTTYPGDDAPELHWLDGHSVGATCDTVRRAESYASSTSYPPHAGEFASNVTPDKFTVAVNGVPTGCAAPGAATENVAELAAWTIVASPPQGMPTPTGIATAINVMTASA